MRLLLLLGLLASLSGSASDSTKLYHPYANAVKDVQQAVAKAKKEKKHLLIQVGGNWCVWCSRFNSFVQSDKGLKQLLHDNYVVYHLNHSNENKNLAYLKKLGYPQRFGFPVFVILDEEGKRIHTQDSGLLEKGNSYDVVKVKSFLQQWVPGVLKQALYKE